MNKISISVFFPAYNEEENLTSTVDNAVKVLKETAQEWEIIIVDDGSTDGTYKVAELLSKKDKRISVVTHSRNKGYGEALKSGFKTAKYPWVAFSDSDGQFDFSEIEKLIEKTNEADLVLGYRLHRADPLARKIGTWVWNLFAKMFLGLWVKDYSCGFKLIRKEAYEKTLPLTCGEKVTQIEMLVKARRNGAKFAEVGVHHFPRRFGTQTGANIRVIAKSFFDLFRLWWNLSDKRMFIILSAILAVAAFLRMYRISEYMTFLGDEGRDVILVRRLLVNFDPILIGPGTSIGNMYLGPLYYYLMAPVLLLSGLSPIGPALQVAVLGVITCWLIYHAASIWSGRVAGIVATALYAVSPVVIIHSRSSWNPNIMPIFALASIYSIWKVWKEKSYGWMIILGISYAFVLQSHYLGLLLLPVVALFWLLSAIYAWPRVDLRKRLRLYSLFSILIFLFLMSPLVIFDARHGWHNFEAMKIFFTQRQETVSAKPWSSLPHLWPVWEGLFVERIMAAGNYVVGNVLAFALIAGSLLFILKKKLKFFSSNLFLLLTWIFVGTLGVASIKQNVYDHYFGFMFAAPFILLGIIAQKIYNLQFTIYKILMIGCVIALVAINLIATPIKSPPARQLQRTEEVARKIADESGGKPLNLAVLAERNYEDAYQYFLEWWRYPVRDIDPLLYDQTVADQLFVVCELPPVKCDPTHNSKAEITVFGWSKIDGEWDVAGVKLYKLGHNPSGKPQ